MSLSRALEIIDAELKLTTRLNSQLAEAVKHATNEDQRIGTSLLIDRNSIYIRSLNEIRVELTKGD